MALRYADVSVQAMADEIEIGVSRTTVCTWLNDRHVPRVGFLKLWALRAGVSHEWLTTSAYSSRNEQRHPVGCLCAECARRDSNPQPSDP